MVLPLVLSGLIAAARAAPVELAAGRFAVLAPIGANGIGAEVAIPLTDDLRLRLGGGYALNGVENSLNQTMTYIAAQGAANSPGLDVPFDRAQGLVLLDHDFGARTVLDGFSGALHVMGGGGVAWMERWELTVDNDAVDAGEDDIIDSDLAGRSLVPQGAIGVGIGGWYRGRVGVRTRILALVRPGAIPADLGAEPGGGLSVDWLQTMEATYAF